MGGAAPRKQSKAIWKRFRGACDQFFDRRKADLAERKHVWAKNYERKEALCREAEALGESADASAVEAVKRLQAEWRKVGPVKRSRSDAIWERFQTACGRVADRVLEKEEAALADKVAAREALCAELGVMARERFRRAAQALPGSERRAMRPALLMRGVYESYLDRIEANRFRVAGPPIKFSATRKITLVLGALLKTL